MHLSIAATLLACTAGAQAFVDSSPFVLFSTSALPKSSNNAQLQTSAQVLASAKELLTSCPTDRYILVSQPNLHAADIRREGTNPQCMTPTLCGVGMDEKSSVYSVAEVIGQISGRPLKEYIVEACKAKGKEGVQIDRVELKHLPAVGDKSLSEERRETLRDNDLELDKLLHVLDEYTVIMFSDPNELRPYEPEFSSEPAAHMDLKRWSEENEYLERRKPNSTGNHLPLFEKYQFFTPGVFMSLIVVIVILSILSVGLRALASLEVSYGAFDKEMGPAAQKKQM
ncbi:BIG/ATPase V1 complex, subunit S1 [Cladorrhinum sp. PSN332]|nr:BIG/ATPase V1 complex, subunit S1 [Cladorrhinum sp. PSN332]